MQNAEGSGEAKEGKEAELPYYDFVVVGGGVAAFTAAREVLRLSRERGMAPPKLLMIGDEQWAPYVRYPLSKNLWCDFFFFCFCFVCFVSFVCYGDGTELN